VSLCLIKKNKKNILYEKKNNIGVLWSPSEADPGVVKPPLYMALMGGGLATPTRTKEKKKNNNK
jgi:hypothetical protein